MNPRIEVLGWDAAKGAAVRISTYNPGRRNRRNRWSIDDHGDHIAAVYPQADWGDVRDPSDRRRKVGVVFNIGHLYDVDVTIDGEYEHTLLVDASEDYQVISYYDHQSLRVKSVRVNTSDDSGSVDDSAGDDEDGPPVEDREVASEEE